MKKETPEEFKARLKKRVEERKEREKIMCPAIPADVYAEVSYIKTEDGGRHTPAMSGYRPSHLVKEDYLTTGLHRYIDKELVFPGESAMTAIWFLSPEVYPHCLWVGKTIKIQEGANVVGYAKIERIFNKVLEKDS